jgi:hypothetical protein
MTKSTFEPERRARKRPGKSCGSGGRQESKAGSGQEKRRSGY